MASMLSRFRRQQSSTRKPNRSRRLLLEQLEDRIVPSSLQVSISPHTILEGTGANSTAIGTVTRVGVDTSQALTVNLSSSDTTEATVPATVLIPAGQASATFNITAVMDYTPDGSQNATITATAQLPTHVQPDTTFAGTGSVLQGSITQDVALQPDGKIVTAGMRYNGGSSNFYDFAISRFNANGSPDTTFGSNGTVFTDVSGQSDKAHAVLIQPDGKILVGGTGGDGPHFFFVLARYNPNGTLDTTFGNGGKIITDPSPNGAYNEIWDLALQPDGRILAGGDITIGNDTEFAVARYNPNGSLDTYFGSNGIATSNPTTGTSDRAYSVLVQPDGRIVLVGGSAGGNSVAHFALSRFTSWGSIDYSFGASGTVLTDLPGTYEQAFDAALQPDGKIVAVGQTSPTGAPVYNFALARYNPDGSLDSSFGSSGFVTTDCGGNDQAEGVALTPDGRIVVVGGGVTTSASTEYTQIVSYNADGTFGNAWIGRNTGVMGQAVALQADGSVVAVSSQNTAFGGYIDRFTPVMLISGSDTVTVQDDPNPSIQSDAYYLSEDQTFNSSYNYPNYSVLSNDYSPNGGLTTSLVTGPSHGTVSLNADGSFTYTPAPNYNGPDSFVYQATDPLGMGGQATVSLTVYPMDDPTQLSLPGPQTIAEDTSVTFSAANGNAITVTDLDTPRMLVSLLVQDGILNLPSTAGLEFPYPDSINNSAHITFYADNPAEANAALDGLVLTPNPNFHGTINLNVWAEDTTSTSYYGQTSANVAITVTSVNDAPVAVADSYQATEDQTFSTYGLGVLSNDSDVDGDPLSAVLVSGPAHGTVNLSTNGTFTYTPAPNYNGPDSFTYSAKDPAGLLSAPATVSLDVFPVDDPTQVTAPGSQTIAEDTSFTFSAANNTAITITDIESPRLEVVLLAQNGILSLPNTAGLEFPDPASLNNTAHIAFDADNPAEANAALDGLVFTPAANYNGSVYFNVWVQDLSVVSSYPVTASASTTITVTPVNDAPVAVDDGYAVQAGVPFVTAPYSYGGNIPGVLANDQDVDGDQLTAAVVSGPAHGSMTFNSDGSFTYTADATYTGSDTFTYRASDGQLQSTLATVTFTVSQNLPPVTGSDAYSVNEDSSLSVAAPGVLGNDSDPEGQPLTAQLGSGPAHGTLSFNSNGSFTYTPAANYNGADQFSYQASDSTFLSNPVAVALTINPVNDPPIACNDTYSLNEDNVLTVAASGVLANDSDIDGDTLSASLVNGPSHGVVNVNADGSFIYTPNVNYNGSDSFTYKANDGQADSNVATVSLTVNAVNDAPVAVNDAYTLNEDQTLTVAPTPGVTSLTMVSQPGDYIGQGQTYSFTPQTGTFMVNRNFDNGVSIFYSGSGQSWNLDFAAPFDAALTPGTYANATRWPFQATGVAGLNVSGDGRGSNTLTGSFTVTQALFAADGTVLRFAASFVQHSEGTTPALTGTINYNQGNGPSGILLNDSDVEGSPLSIIVVSNPAHGSLSMNVDGSFKYTPNANYNGPDSFTYKVNDGQADSNVATVSLTVNPVNDFPVANNDFYTIAEDNVLTVAAPGVLANDSDVDGDSLTATLVTSTTHGSLAFHADGSFVYTPQANYNGSDSFQYAAYDGQAFSFIRTATITVTPVNDAPTAVNDSYTTAEDTPLTVAAPGVLGNDTDVEGSALTARLVSGPGHGTLALNSNGSFTYTPNANYNGTDSFTYKANDGAADGNVATVSLTISAVNDAPTATGDAYTLNEDQALTIPAPGVLGNDGDVDGDPLSAVLVSGPVHGTLNWNADGSFVYTPNANFNGSDSITYKANDGSLDSNVATVSLTITPVNDPPVVNAGPDQTLNEGSTASFSGTASDVDGDPLSYLWDFGDGATSSSAAPTHRYADNGTFTVTLTVNDGQGGSTLDSLVVTILNVAPTLTLSGATAVNEGSTYTLNLAASDPGQDTITNWTITWGDGNIQTVSGSPGSVSHTYADGSQTCTISATATDEDGTYNAGNSLNVTVNNVAPTASLSGPATGVRGQLRTFALGAVDPSAIDQAGSFTFNINWGDGSSQPSTGPASQQVGHVYTTAGTYTVQLTATDKDGGVSTTVQQTITIKAVDVQAGTLVIGGTTADDNITVAPADASGNLAVTINGTSQGTFAAPAQLVVYGQSGNDQIKLVTKKIGNTTYYVTAPAALFGDAGNDTLDARGSTANNILVGGAGTDTLQGGSGRDLLIGGGGGDTLHGNGGDDIVIGNSTDYDSNLAALNAVMAEWGRTDADYTTRVNHLNGSAGGGLNGGYFLNSATVHDDAAVDQLYGEANIDWFFSTASGTNKDKVNDLVSGEIVTAQ